MKQQIKHSVFRAILLTVALVLMTAWAASAVVAYTGDAGKALVIHLGEDVNSCKITYVDPNGIKQEETVISGKTYYIGHGTTVEGTISTKTGKIAKEFTTTDLVQPPRIYENKFTWGDFDTDVTVTINCTNRTYKIQAVDFNFDAGLANPTYTPVDANMTDYFYDLWDGKVEYTRSDDPSQARVELPVVQRKGHEFKNEWRIRTGDTSISILPDPNDGKYYISNNLDLNEIFDKDGIIYVYPVMERKTTHVYRLDCIYGADGEVRIHVTSQEALKDQYASGLYTTEVVWKDDILNDDGTFSDYKSYPGFEIVTDPAVYARDDDNPLVYFDIKDPNIDPIGENINCYRRYYKPINYNLEYYDTDGASLAEASNVTLPTPALPGVYPYYTKTPIGNAQSAEGLPQKVGYTFAGWEVWIFKNNNYQKVDDAGIDLILGGKTITAGAYYAYDENKNKPVDDPNAIYASENNTIRLIAKWTPNVYQMTYVLSTDSAVDTALKELLANQKFADSADNTFTFDSHNGLMPLSVAVRPGYTFVGWALETKATDGTWVPVGDLDQNDEGTAWVLPTNIASEVRLTAKWTAEEYAVTLDPALGTLGTFDPIRVTFDTQLSISNPDAIIPVRKGYTFLGYFTADGVQYINADGTPIQTLWKQDDGEGDPGSVTLYAHWQINEYNISFGSADTGLEGVIITVTTDVEIHGSKTHVLEPGETLSLPYNTAFTVTVQTPAGYKLVKFDGTLIEHTASFETESTVDAWDVDQGKNFAMLILKERTLTLPGVNYHTEVFTGLAAGSYRITWVENGETKTQVITIRESGTAYGILNHWFGKELTFIYLGDDVNSSNSEPQTMTLAARPAAPNVAGTVLNPEISGFIKTEYSIKVNMASDIEGLYQYALVKYTGNAVDIKTLTWQPSPEFTNLDPGTGYNIYIRKTATDDAPCGECIIRLEITETADYVKDIKDQLDQLLGEDAGEVSKELIENAKAEIDRLVEQVKNGEIDNFYQQVQNIFQIIRDEQLAVALAKDRAITALREFRDACVSTGFFIEPKVQELDLICNTAIDNIKNLVNPTEGEIQAIYDAAMIAMKAVEIHRLTKEDGDVSITVESDKGLYQDSRLTILSEAEFQMLAQAIDKAIRTPGKVTVNGFMTVAEAEEILRTLDVFASYRFDMTHSDKIKDGDVFTVRLRLNDAMKAQTGLRVAYYDDQTGTIELLDTRVEGEYLVFTASRIADFVILSDPTLHLEGVIIALGTVLLCQLIAIIAVLVSRNKAKKQVTHFSVALPIMALAVHFSPVGGEMIALIMAGAVILLQIILMALLISSGMIRLPKRAKEETPAKNTPVQTPDEPLYAVPSNELYAEPETPSEEVDPSLESSDEVDAYASFDFDAEEAGESLGESDDASEETDPFALYDEDSEAYAEEYGEDFIEPAVATRYSLPDEEALYGEEDVEDIDDASAEEELAYADEVSYTEDAYTDEIYAEDEAYTEEPYAEEGAEELYQVPEEDDYSDLYATVPAEEVLYTAEPMESEQAFYDAENSEEGIADEEETEPDVLSQDEDPDSIYRYDE